MKRKKKKKAVKFILASVETSDEVVKMLNCMGQILYDGKLLGNDSVDEAATITCS